MRLRLAAFLLLPTLGLGQDLAPRVTFACPAEPVAKALAELSRKIGVSLTAAPQTASEIVTFRFKDVPSAEALKRIAATMDAEWRAEGTGYRLVRSEPTLARERKRELAVATEAYRKEFARRRTEFAKLKPFDAAEAKRLATEYDTARRRSGAATPPDFAQMERLEKGAPANRALASLLLAFDPATLAALPAYTPVVFATRPNAMQRPLPPSAAAILARYQQAQSLWADAAEKRGIQSDDGVVLGGLGENLNAPPATLGKVLLVVSPRRAGEGFQAELMIGDAKGKIIGQAEDEVFPGFSEEVPTVPAPQAGPKETPLRLSPEAAELIASSDPVHPEPVSAPLKTVLTHPEQTDPLSFVASDVLAQCADVRKENLVAVLPDTMALSGVNARQMPTASAYLRGLDGWMNVEEGQGWMTVAPVARASTRELQVDRRSLGEYLRFTASNPQPTLEERARFALALPDPNDNSLPGDLAQRFGNEDLFFTANETVLLRFYGTLSPAQRAMATQPGGLPFASLTPSQLARLFPLLYGERSGGAFDYEADRDGTGMPVDDEREELYFNGLLREPTESLPNGIPSQGVLHLAVDDQSAVYPDTSQSKVPMGLQPMTAEEVAMRKVAKAQGLERILSSNLEQTEDPLPLDRVFFGSRRVLSFRFVLTKNLSSQGSLTEAHLLKGRSIPYASLPEEFRKRVDAEVTERQKRFDEMEKVRKQIEERQKADEKRSGTP